jgi:hypothetical protein
MPVLACNLNAISESELPTYKSLCARLREAITERRELADGYAFRLSDESMSLVDAARWVNLERLCCPFLTFGLEITGSDHDYWLMLEGPPEAKAIVREALVLEVEL